MSSAQRAYNKAHGLPASWTPPEFLGPANSAASLVKTPGGIRVRHNGFKSAKKPEFKQGIRARVILENVDAIWKEVRRYLSEDNPYKLEPPVRAKLRKLPGGLPSVSVEPSIWWSEPHGFYLGGVFLPDQGGIRVTVWYKSTLNGSLVNWETLLHHEFQHLALQWAGANMWLPDGYGERAGKEIL